MSAPGSDIMRVAAALVRRELLPTTGRISKHERANLSQKQGDLGVRLRVAHDEMKTEADDLRAQLKQALARIAELEERLEDVYLEDQVAGEYE